MRDDMNVQKSFIQSTDYTAGILYLVGTPIGNLEDITYRAIRILKEMDWIAAEDTRQTRKLLSHYEISTRLLSYHEHNKQTSGEDLIHKLLQGESIALVSDAGLPAISDPGYELVRQAIAENIHVVPIPGANAALSALIISGLNTAQFLFLGFLPKDKKNITSRLEELKGVPDTMLFYESPHRISKTLKMMLDTWGDRQIAMARELTKKFEEVARGKISEALQWLSENPARGEYCIVVDGLQQTQSEIQDNMWWTLLSIREHVDYYVEEGNDRKEAMKKAALDRKVPKREIYNKLLIE
jgi:16S rRNA (cytidine1402-2'-O)-methyltransferase